MANIYVYSGAAGAGTGADWTNAYTTLKAAAEAAGTAAGDDIWVAHDNAETGAIAATITFKGTGASPTRVICVNRAGSVPPVAADIRNTATITTTGGSTLGLIGPTNGANYIEGFTFNCGSGAVASALSVNIAPGAVSAMWFRNCSFKKLGTTVAAASGGAIILGATRNVVVLENCNIEVGNVGDGIRPSGYVEWRGGTITGATIPNNLVTNGSAVFSTLFCYGCDFSPLGAGTVIAGSNQSGIARLFNCKLGASTVIGSLAGQTSMAGNDVAAINCDGGSTNYRTERVTYAGVQITETTIVRTGGATDGTTPISWNLTSTANSEPTFPFESLPITVWSDTTGAKTVSLYGYWDSAVVPTNAQIWMVAEYLGTSGFPVTSFVSSGPATILTAGSNIASDSSTWGGGDTTTRFKMSVSLTTAKKGPITVKVYVAVPSTTFYIDPKIEVV